MSARGADIPAGLARSCRLVAWLALSLVLLLVVAAAGAQPASADAEPAPSDEESPGAGLLAAGGLGGGSHGWVLIPGGRPRDLALWHAPPRSLESVGQPAVDGTFKRVRGLAEPPAFMAAQDRRLWMIFAVSGKDASLRSVDAVPGTVPGTWGYLPEGRLRAHPSPGKSEHVVGLTATARGPVVRERAPGEGRDSLKILEQDAWRALPELPFEGAAAGVLASDGGLVVLREAEDGTLRSWTLEFRGDAPVVPGDAPADESAAGASDGTPGAIGAWVRGPDFALVEGRVLLRAMFGPEMVTVARGEVGVRLSRQGPTGRLEGEPIGVDGVVVAALALPGSDRVAIVGIDAADPTRVRVIEVSVWTGRVLYDGKPRYTSPISPTEFRLLALGLFLMVALMLIFLLRDGAGGEVALREGWSLADPVRRLAALGVDLLIAGWVSARLNGIGVPEAFTIDALSVDRGGHWGLVVTLAVGFVLGTVSEGIAGASPGKLLFGLRVVRATPEGGRPGARRSLVRNACKWIVPPLAAIAFFDPNGRHRGDTLAGTVVVQPAPEPDEV